jgi:hypothetical protein
MKEFCIDSVDSDLKLILNDLKGDYFTVHLVSNHLTVVREIYAYTRPCSFPDLMESLAIYEKPWTGVKRWESLEGEFKFSASCNIRGNVTFEIELVHYGIAEEWLVKTQLNTEFGQLPKLAKAARSFFGDLYS